MSSWPECASILHPAPFNRCARPAGPPRFSTNRSCLLALFCGPGLHPLLSCEPRLSVFQGSNRRGWRGLGAARICLDGDMFWLFEASSSPEWLHNDETIGGTTFDAGTLVVRGTWFERNTARGADAREYVSGEPSAVASHTIMYAPVDLVELSPSGGQSRWLLTVIEEGRVSAALRTHEPLACKPGMPTYPVTAPPTF